ncbi:unnamed protein product [Parajaminaea phylloscopi]
MHRWSRPPASARDLRQVVRPIASALTVMMMMEAQAASEAGPSSGMVPSDNAMAQSLLTFRDAVHALTQSLLSQWQGDSQLRRDDAEATFQYLTPQCQKTQAQVQQNLTSEPAWSTFREIAAAELRWSLTTALGDRVDLEAPATLAVYATLDVATAFQETGLADGSLALLLIEETCERLAIDSVNTMFGYLESRVTWLTRDLSPSRGKGLVLLRLLNDLLRRLSKPSRSHLVLSGRILTLLASVFPLGERSGVNLRGEFNVGNVTKFEDSLDTQEEPGKGSPAQALKDTQDGETDDTDKDADPAAIAARDASFYSSFWSLQTFFANPTLLFESSAEATDSGNANGEGEQQLMDTRVSALAKVQEGGTPSGSTTPQRPVDNDGKGAREAENEEGATANEGTFDASMPTTTASPFETFRATTRRVLDIFAEASARDQEMEQAERAATKGGGSTILAKKRKREEMLQNHVGLLLDQAGEETEPPVIDATCGQEVKMSLGDAEEGAFPKFLTGRRVFEYQLRSPAFRRHLMLQYLILFQYLLSFNPQQKKRAQESWKNKQLFLAYPAAADYVLAEEDEQWIRRSWKEIAGLLDETGTKDQGRNLRNSVLQMLRREARWIHWKAENCPQIDRPGIEAEEVEASRSGRETLLRPRPALAHSLGTAALSELWEDGLEPIVAGKRRTENEEGEEIEIATDGLEQLEMPPGIPSVVTYAKMAKQQAARGEMRLRKLDAAPPSDATSEDEGKKAEREAKARKLLAEDEELRLIEERRISLNWRALRIARGNSLRLWGKIEGGEIDLLLQAEEDEAAKAKAAINGKKAREGDLGSSTPAATHDSVIATGASTAAAEETKASVATDDTSDTAAYGGDGGDGPEEKQGDVPNDKAQGSADADGSGEQTLLAAAGDDVSEDAAMSAAESAPVTAQESEPTTGQTPVAVVDAGGDTEMTGEVAANDQ